jgi:hypothetical protein
MTMGGPPADRGFGVNFDCGSWHVAAMAPTNRRVDAAKRVPYKPAHLRAYAPKSAQSGHSKARWRRRLS